VGCPALSGVGAMSNSCKASTVGNPIKELDMNGMRRIYERGSPRGFLGITLLSIFMLCSMIENAAAQTPVTYSFTTGDALTINEGCPACLFAGQSVSGTFVYDHNVPAVGTTDNGETIYVPIIDLAGSIAEHSFSDPQVGIFVGNDTFFGFLDVLFIFTEPIGSTLPPSFFNLIGFDIDGFTLVNVSLIWVEVLLGATDFLSDQNLPGVLPSFQGRLALAFTPTNNPGQLFFVLFDGLIVSPVLPVDIDIKPGKFRDRPNRLDPNDKSIKVAILGTNDFDVLQVDQTTIRFGPDEAPLDPAQCKVKDFNEDGLSDLSCKFKMSDTGIACGDTEATLIGKTFGGESISGTDSIETVGCT